MDLTCINKSSVSYNVQIVYNNVLNLISTIRRNSMCLANYVTNKYLSWLLIVDYSFSSYKINVVNFIHIVY